MGLQGPHLWCIKMENERVQQETIKMEETRKQPSRLEGPGGAMLPGVIGAVLTVGC